MAPGLPYILVVFAVGAYSQNVVKIGVLLPMDVKFQFSMQKSLPAIELAVEHVDRMGMLPDHKMKILYKDSNCSMTDAQVAAVDLYTDKNVNVFLGPVCEFAAAPVARFTESWNIPLITSGALAGAFNNKDKFGLLTRVQGSYTQVGEIFVQLMILYKWTHVGLMYSTSSSEINKECFLVMDAIYQAVKTSGLESRYVKRIDLDAPDVDLETVVEGVRRNARILAVCATPDLVRELVLQAQESYTDFEDFVFFNFDLFGRSSSKPWYRADDTDARNNQARRAYEAVKTVSLRTPSSYQYLAFSRELKRRAGNQYSDEDVSQPVNSHIGAFYDGVLLYATALKEHLESGGSVSDGAQITHRMWNRTFQGITGTVSINDNGDRNMDLSLLDMNVATGNFEVVANYHGDRKFFEPVEGKQIYWAGGRISPPPDEPECGYDGTCPPGGVTTTESSVAREADDSTTTAPVGAKNGSDVISDADLQRLQYEVLQQEKLKLQAETVYYKSVVDVDTEDSTTPAPDQVESAPDVVSDSDLRRLQYEVLHQKKQKLQAETVYYQRMTSKLRLSGRK